MSTERIAIVGTGAIFPGAKEAHEFWELLREGRSAARTVPANRWTHDPESLVESSGPAPDRVLSSKACLIDDLDLSFASDLGIDAGYLESLDPLYHLALYAAKKALHKNPQGNIPANKCSLVFGNIALPTSASSAHSREILGKSFVEEVLKEKVEWPSETAGVNRFVTGLPAGLVAKTFGFEGGCYTLDAACASSLYALKFAADELRSGRSDLVLAGGLSRPDCQYTQMGFSQLKALSTTGQCSPFDAKGNGLVVGEGCGLFVLKRLSDAIEAGDEIQAVLCGFGLSNDVDGNLLAPSSEGQLRALKTAYDEAGWNPHEVDLIECHATGTPLGDGTEVSSLRELWASSAEGAAERDKACVLGAVKSNIGHALTAAGAAGLWKVLLAFENSTLPPTANFESAAKKVPLTDSPFKVLSKSEKWSKPKDRPRRAALNAFGFGGINAHVLIEEWDAEAEKKKLAEPESKSASLEPKEGSGEFAIVGMGAHCGPFNGLRAFQERVLGGNADAKPQDLDAWWGIEDREWYKKQSLPNLRGYFVDKISIPYGRFRVPPKELEESLPQQLLLLNVAHEAFENARISQEDLESLGMRTGVYIGLGLDLNTNHFSARWQFEEMAQAFWNKLTSSNESMPKQWLEDFKNAYGPALNANRTMGALGGIVASRVAREFHVGGPSFTVSSEESSGLRALHLAAQRLALGEIDQALVGAVDLSADPRSVLGFLETRPFANDGSPFHSESKGAMVGEGACALILKRLEDAKRDGDRIYSVLKGMGCGSGGDSQSSYGTELAYQQSFEEACSRAQWQAQEIQLMETHGSAISAEDKIEANVLNQQLDQDCVVSSAKADIGHTGACSGLASVLKASLALYHEVLPAFRSQANAPVDMLSAGFIPEDSRYWLRDQALGERKAMVASMGMDGTCLHAALAGYASSQQPQELFAREQGHALGALEEGLFAFSAESSSSLQRKLNEFATWLNQQPNDAKIDSLARTHAKVELAAESECRLALVAKDQDQLADLIQLARVRMDSEEKPLASPLNDRIFYCSSPLLRQTESQQKSELAFCFPGSGNHFMGMGRRFGLEWPAILRHQDSTTSNLKSQWSPMRLWQTTPYENFKADAKSPIFGQVVLGTLVSDLLRSWGVEPDAMLGYSLGETVSYFSSGTWNDRDEMYRRVDQSSLFTTDLAGPFTSVAKAWGLASDAKVDWVIGVVTADSKSVQQELQKLSRAYLLIVNTPNECVIGGDRQEVEKLVAQLGADYHSLNGVTSVHCPVAKPVEKPYHDLHLFDVNPPEHMRFYSCVSAQSHKPSTENTAASILGQALEGFDFPKLVEQAYEDGVRVFVEIGPGASLTRFIGDILGDRPHAVRSACPSGQGQLTSMLRLMGMLFSQGAYDDLSEFYKTDQMNQALQEYQASLQAKKPEITVPVGCARFDQEKIRQLQSEASSFRPAVSKSSQESIPSVQPQARVVQQAQEAVLAHSEVQSFESTSRFTVNEPKTISSTPSMLKAEQLLEQMQEAQRRSAEAHQRYLQFNADMSTAITQNFEAQLRDGASAQLHESPQAAVAKPQAPSRTLEIPAEVPRALSREACMEFAIGTIERTLGSEFAEVDQYPTRVRLPDEPLMLVDRITHIGGEAKSMQPGTVVTEHDVTADKWYLDCGRIPVAVAVEAGQADLFLAGFMGIDFETKGLACYRLLDAVVTFHDELPGPGSTIVYDIRIKKFFQHAGTWFFHFEFEGSVNGKPLITMRDGCAGFFTQEALDAGQGIVRTAMQNQARAGILSPDYQALVPMQQESYSDEQVVALRAGRLQECFGESFANLNVQQPETLPGGKMRLIDRVPLLDPKGGRFGLGLIRAELDIHPDDWFLTCHFVDDMVMPGTLMYECCLHTLRIFLLRMGWVAESGQVSYLPRTEVPGQLKCRGQVLQSTKVVTYEVELKEIAYGPEPYAICDALMYADGKAIVEIVSMSVALVGQTKESLAANWGEQAAEELSPALASIAKPAIYDNASIIAFAEGKPSEAFGDRYQVFDTERKIARLPRAPYKFLDRVVEIERGIPWELVAGESIEAQYDVPADEWYFSENGFNEMPFAILLEVALQPCGWLAAYLGSALTSETDLKFRNLGGKGIQHLAVTPSTGTLAMKVKMTAVSSSGGMIIQHYTMSVHCSEGLVYEGTTYFGFFSKDALANQVGIREIQPYALTTAELDRARSFDYPKGAPFPGEMMQMLDEVTHYVPDGGPNALGVIRGHKRVNPQDWFFQAHFYEDPVWPGSLGLEAMNQLLLIVAQDKFQCGEQMLRSNALSQEHEWVYRGQVIPKDKDVYVEVVITKVDAESGCIWADGFLIVDERIIYQMKDFSVQKVAE